MSTAYVCLSCRSSRLLRGPSRLSSNHYPGLTGYRESRSLIAARESSRPLYTCRRDGNSHWQVLWQHEGRARSWKFQARNQHTGRYSGRPLEPQGLLDELDHDGEGWNQKAVSPRDRRPQNRHARRPVLMFNEPAEKAQEHWTALHANLPEHVFAKFRRFAEVATEKTDAQSDSHIRSQYSILQVLARQTNGTEYLRTLTRSLLFRRNCLQWLKGVCWTWKRNTELDAETSETGIHGTELPSPRDALMLISVFEGAPNDYWATALRLMSMSASEDYAGLGKQRALSQEALIRMTQNIMWLWSDCLSLKTQRERDNNAGPIHNMQGRQHLTDLDFSFLPHPEHLREAARTRSDTNARPLFFPEVIDMIRGLDTGSPTTNTSTVGRHPPDYATPALVTLDLLRHMSAMRDEGSVETWESWRKLMEIAVEISESRVSPKWVSAKILHTNNPQIVQHYEAMLHRWGFSLPRRGPRGLELEDMKQTQQMAEDADTDHVERSARILSKERLQSLPAAGRDHFGVAFPTEEKRSVATNQNSPQLLSFNRRPPSLSAEEAENTNGFVELQIQRLGRAVERQDYKAADRVRSDVQNSVDRNGQLPLALYEQLLLSFLTLKRVASAVDVWKDMINAGHQPTCKTYTVMMRGSLKVKDQAAMEGFWTRMRQSGVQADAYAWSARIYGLLQRRAYVEKGMQALNEMGQEWLTAAHALLIEQATPSTRNSKQIPPQQSKPADLVSRFSEDINGRPRPSVVILNSAISGLAASDDALIPRVLSWGRSFGIEPNVVTYNALLNISMRRGLPKECMAILKRMKDRGVDTNSATWTVLLTGMFEGGMLDELEPHEQVDRVLNLIGAAGSVNGVGLDAKGYAVAIDRLLKKYNNPLAVQKVLADMAERGMQPSPQIYTIVLGSYFRQSPPDLAAVESLWKQIQSTDSQWGAALDAQFYDRLIEGYAANISTAGTSPMLKALSHMDAEGKKPSWRALEHAARALAEASQWERLAQLVAGVRSRMSEGGVGETTYGQRSFWEFVLSTGLLSHEGIYSVKQLTQMHTGNNNVVRKQVPGART